MGWECDSRLEWHVLGCGYTQMLRTVRVIVNIVIDNILIDNILIDNIVIDNIVIGTRRIDK